MSKFDIFIENNDFREDVIMNNDISSNSLYNEQMIEGEKYDSQEVCRMVSSCFEKVKSAAILLSANGMFLKYAGPTIRRNYQLVKIAVNQNGDAIQFASVELLMSDPSIAADLILSATYGHPCESFRNVINDKDYIFDVCKKIVERDNTMLEWVCSHMYAREGYEVSQQMLERLSSSRTR